MGEVVAGLGVVNDEIPIAAHHRRQIIERDVGARLGIIETPVGVLLDDNRFFFVGRRGLGFVEHGESRLADGWFLHCGSVTHPQPELPAVCVDRLAPDSALAGVMHLAW